MGIKINFDRPWAVELAKGRLKQILSDPLLKNHRIKASLAVQILVHEGLTKSEVKTARKEMGVLSVVHEGVNYWECPKGGRKNAGIDD